MTTRFADTSYYVALTNIRDELHSQAVELARQFRGHIVTTEYVLVELGNWLSQSGDRKSFVKALTSIQADPRTSIRGASQELFDRGCELFGLRQDKDWSLTDCISFVVMQELGLTDALSADHHFEQAGFTILLQ